MIAAAPPKLNAQPEPPPGNSVLQAISKALKQAIETVAGPIDRVLKYDLDLKRNIVGKFNDGDELYDFVIGPDGDIEYGETEVRADAANGRVCTKGRKCGDSCVNKGDKCRTKLSPAVNQKLHGVRGAIEQAKQRNQTVASEGQNSESKPESPKSKIQNPKSEGKQSSGAGGAVAAGVGAALAAGAIGVGATALAKNTPAATAAKPTAEEKSISPVARNAVIASAALIGVPAATYLGVRARYRAGFAESAKMAEEKAGGIEVGSVKERQHSIVFCMGGMAYEDESPQVISGERMANAARLAFSRDKGRDLKMIPISNASANVPEGRKRGNKVDQNLDVLGIHYRSLIKNGRNPAAVEMAANIIAYGDKYPDRQLVMMGHSMGGMVAHEAEEIIRISRPEYKDRLKTFAFGAEWGGMTNEFGKSYTIGSPNDESTANRPARNPKSFEGVEGHNQNAYFRDPDVQKFVQGEIYRDIDKYQDSDKGQPERTDAVKTKAGKPTKAGHVWVEDDRVEDGGYFRKLPKKGAGVGAAVVTGGVLAVGALATGAALRDHSQSQPDSAEATAPVAPSPASDRLRQAAKAGAVLGVGTAAYLGINEMDRRYQIKDKSVMYAAGIAYAGSTKIDTDKLIENLPIKPELKQQGKQMVGAAKVYFARTALEKSGSKLISVDPKNNFSTYKSEDGSLYSVGSVDSKVVVFGSSYEFDAEGTPVYNMEFNVDASNHRNPRISREQAGKIVRLVKSNYQNHVENLPEKALVKATPYKDDGAGAKRQSIYERQGFTTLPITQDPMVEYAARSITRGALWVKKQNGRIESITEDEQYGILAQIKTGMRNRTTSSRKDADSNKPTKAGHVWVEDKRVKEGGYFRKLPKGTRVAASVSAPQQGSGIAKTLLTGAALASVAAVGAGIATGKISTEPIKEKFSAIAERGKQAAGLSDQQVEDLSKTIAHKLSGDEKKPPTFAQKAAAEVGVQMANRFIFQGVGMGVDAATGGGNLLISKIASIALARSPIGGNLRDKLRDEAEKLIGARGFDSRRGRVLTGLAINSAIFATSTVMAARAINNLDPDQPKDYAEFQKELSANAETKKAYDFEMDRMRQNFQGDKKKQRFGEKAIDRTFYAYWKAGRSERQATPQSNPSQTRSQTPPGERKPTQSPPDESLTKLTNALFPAGASQEDIKRAYRGLAKKVHPDAKGPAASAEEFERLQQAYELAMKRFDARLDGLVELVRQDASDQFLDGFWRGTRQDSKLVRAGYTWVDDKRVKAGGYWRKLPKGARVGNSSDRPTKLRRGGGKTALALSALVGAAALGTAGVAVARSAKRQLETEKTSLLQQGEEIAQRAVQKGVSIAATTGAVAGGVGVAGGVIATRWATQEGVKRQVDTARRQAEESTRQQVEQVRLEAEVQLGQAVSKAEADTTTRLEQEHTRSQTELETRYQQQLNELDAGKQQAETALGKANQRTVELEGGRSAVEGQLSEAQRRVTELESSRTSLQQELGQKTIELEQANRSTAELQATHQQQVGELEGGRSTVEGQLGEVRRQVTELESSRTSLQQELERKTVELEQANRSAAELQASHQRQIGELEGGRSAVEGQLSEAQRRANELEASRSRLQQEVETQRSTLDRIKQSARERVKKLGQQVRNLRDNQQQAIAQGIEEGVRPAVAELETRKAQLDRDYEERVNILVREHGDRLQRLRVETEAELSRRTAEIETRVVNEKSRELEALRQQDLEQLEQARGQAIDEGYAEYDKFAVGKTKRAALVSNAKEGIALKTSIRRDLKIEDIAPAELENRFDRAVDKLVADQAEQLRGALATPLQSELNRIRGMQANSNAKWEKVEHALIRQGNRLSGLDNAVGEVRKEYKQKHKQALREYYAAVEGRGSHDEDLIGRLDEKLTRLNRQMQKALDDAVRQVITDQPLDRSFLGNQERRSDAEQPASIPSNQETLQRIQQQIQRLVRDAIASINSTIQGMPQVGMDDKGNFSGKFRATGGKFFAYSITPKNKISVQEIMRADRMDDDVDRCREGNPCKGQCIPRAHECLSELVAANAAKVDRARSLYETAQKMASSKTGGEQAVGKLIAETIEKRELPSRRRTLGTLTEVGKEFFRNPVKEIKRGLEREKLVREAVAIAAEQDLTHKQAVRKGAKAAAQGVKRFIADNPEKVEEVIVGLTGFAVSQVGSLLGGPVGEKAGDLIGSTGARKALRDYHAMKAAKANLQQDETYQKADRVTRLKMLRKATIAELKSNKEKTGTDMTGDVAGWVAGNSGGDVAGTVGKVTGIPLAGAAGGITTAMEVAPKVVEARARIRSGESAGQVVKETAQEIAKIPGKRVRQVRKLVQEGNERERRVRQKVNATLKAAKSVGVI